MLDLVHLQDVVTAFEVAASRLMHEDRVGQRCYAVRGGQPRSLRDIVGLLEKAMGHPLPIAWGKRPYREREVMVPWRGGEVLPGWRPQIDLADGLAAMVCALQRDRA
jgi:nucleoside-diphosphate-sugar epimerase